MLIINQKRIYGAFIIMANNYLKIEIIVMNISRKVEKLLCKLSSTYHLILKNLT